MLDESHINQVTSQLQANLYGFINPAMTFQDIFCIVFEELFDSIKGAVGVIQLVTPGARECYFGYTPADGIKSWEPNANVACPPYMLNLINAVSEKDFGTKNVYIDADAKLVCARLPEESGYKGYCAIQISEIDEQAVSLVSGIAAHVVKCIRQRAQFDDLQFHEQMVLLEKVFVTLIHDIKNPLSGISGFVQLIDQKANDDSIKKYCGIILESLSQLGDIVTEFKAVISGKEGELVLNRVSVSDLITELIDSIRETYLHNGITLVPVLDNELFVAADRDKLLTVLKHIMKNAKEAMPDGGEVTLQATLDSEKVVLTISDTGIGIPALMQEVVFKPFVSYNKENSAGLGMAMARKIIKEHGGTIAVTSYLGKGTVFTIHLPVFTKEAVL